MISRIRSALWPVKHREEAQRAVEDSKVSLAQARVHRALSQFSAQEMEQIIQQNNFGAHAIHALGLGGEKR